MEVFSPLVWKRGTLYVLDHRALPATATWLPCTTFDDVVQVIQEQRVRGAAAIACAAAYGVALAARQRLAVDPCDARVLQHLLEEAVAVMRKIAPASVPVFWALAQVRDAARVSVGTSDAFMVADAVESRASGILGEELTRCQRIGAAGADLLSDGMVGLTLGHHGPALAVLRTAWSEHRRVRAMVCEGRPFLDGARLTAWELARDGMDVTVIPDGAAAGLLARKEIQVVVLGADRITPAGDVVTDVGAYPIALAAAAAAVPLVIAAPRTCVDPSTSLQVGAIAPEILRALPTAAPVPERVALHCPDADVVPGSLISAIVTETGVLRPPWATSLA